MANFNSYYNKNKNNMQTIIFRADSSSIIGTGHIMRDLVLASKYKNAEIIFASQELDGNINNKIKEAGYKLLILQSNELSEFITVVKEYKADLVVIDSYKIDFKYEEMLKEKTDVQILAFDDTYEKHHCDIVLNHNLSADKTRYKSLVPPTCEVRSGSKYTLLRDEFLQNFPEKEESKYINVLIAMGGVDSRELNIKILDVLETFDNIKIDIITTTANKNLNTLKNYVANSKNITLNINTTEVAKLMHKSDFAIVTPSVTVNEAYFMKLPFIAIKTEENQDDVYNYLQKNNFSVLDKFDEIVLHKKIELMKNKLNSKLINFTELTLDEKKMILEWRNSTSVKRWMYNRDEISLKDHLAYIDSLNSRDDRVYFVLKDKKSYFGVVDLTEIKKEQSAELGIYTNPDLKGYGTLLMSKIIEYAFHKLNIELLTANVYSENIKAINLYKKFNFKAIAIKQDSNGKIVNMELKNENR